MENAFLSHADAAERNRNTILRYLKAHEPVSRTDIWENINISRASVTQVIRQLQEGGLILETGEGESTGGRKPRYLVFNGSSRKFFAFDWTSRALYLMDMNGTVLYEEVLLFPEDVQPIEFGAVIRSGIRRIDEMELCPPEQIIGFALALPGLIDSRSGRLLYSVKLGWQNVSIAELFAQRFGDKVYLERTSNVMAMGEYAIAGQRVSHLQLFILGAEGIGVSSIFRGSCQHGANFMHGELGHIKLPVDVVCSCGQHGCLEAVISKLLSDNGNVLTDQILKYLAIGISTAINIADPGAILLSGSFVDRMTADQKDFLAGEIRGRVIGQPQRRLEIRYSHESRKLILKGISAYVFDRHFAVD